jgi:hypothetical protein
MTSGSFSQFGSGHLHSLALRDPIQPNERLQALRRLIEKVTRQIGLSEVYKTSIPGLAFYRMADLGTPTYCIYEPCVAIILQGAKEITFGEEACEFGQGAFFVTSVDIPTLARVTAASEETPYLSVVEAQPFHAQRGDPDLGRPHAGNGYSSAGLRIRCGVE